MDKCLLCQAEQVKRLLDFGPQPICSRFPASSDANEEMFPIIIGQCAGCGAVQSINPVAAGELKPRINWITYNEPEGHLDQLANTIAGLPGLTPDSVFGGVSFKDDTLLRRMRERGFIRTWRLDPREDLGISEPGIGVETIQDRLTPQTADSIAKRRGKADVLIVRHILEHAHDFAQFTGALKGFLDRHGYVVIEVPDCRRALVSGDYSNVWEEHSLYFTDSTIRVGMTLGGFSVEFFECYPYTLDNSLVAIGRVEQARVSALPSSQILGRELQVGQAFADGWGPQQMRVGNYLREYRQNRGRIAVFGAGHLACTFINLLHLKEHIDCLVDDNPNKRGLYLPGSRLPIFDSRALKEREIKLCLLTVAPESEEKVIERNHAFVAAGGQFRSIFPASKYALQM